MFTIGDVLANMQRREKIAMSRRKITHERIIEAIDRAQTSLDNPGFCRSCGEEQDGCEPDARNYECENCGEFEVFGAEEFLFMV